MARSIDINWNISSRQMEIIKAKNINGKHLELERGMGIEDKEVFIRVIKEGVVDSVKGCWGYDVDSGEFVENLRKSKRLDWI